jgi:hypothetical protein
VIFLSDFGCAEVGVFGYGCGSFVPSFVPEGGVDDGAAEEVDEVVGDADVAKTEGGLLIFVETVGGLVALTAGCDSAEGENHYPKIQEVARVSKRILGMKRKRNRTDRSTAKRMVPRRRSVRERLSNIR